MERDECNTQVDGAIFRALTEKDIALVNEFFDSMGGESRALYNRTDYQRTWALKYCQRQNDPARRYWMAEKDGQMLGFVFLADWNTTIPMLGIGVRDDLKGMHLGSRLMDLAIEEVKKAGKGGIRLTTHIANLRGQMLYEKKGFRCMGQYTNGLEVFYLLWFEDGEQRKRTTL